MLWNTNAVVWILGGAALCATAAAAARHLRAVNTSGFVALIIYPAGAVVAGIVFADFLPSSVGAGSVVAVLLISSLIGYYRAPTRRDLRIQQLAAPSIEEAKREATNTIDEEDRQHALHAQARLALRKRDLKAFDLAIANLTHPGLFLQEICMTDAGEFVKSFLAIHPDPHCVDGFRGYVTALHVAAQRGHDAVVTALLQGGAEPNGRDQWGHTALWYAAVCNGGHLSTVHILMDGGTDPRIADHDGRTPLDWATMKASPDQNAAVVSALRERELKGERSAK